jgi:DNA-binding response OmpR family regulator
VDKTKLLLIDDDIELCDLLMNFLSKEEFTVTAIHDGLEGVTAALEGGYDIIILDVMLPSMNGFEVLRKIQATINTPVLMLTAKGEEVDRIIGLEIGADDYLAKPYSPRELVARLRAILRRSQKYQEPNDKHYQYANIVLNTDTHELYVSEELVPLTQTEYLVLETLLNAAGKVVTKEELSEQALGRKLELYDRSLDMHISHLRSKIGSMEDGNPRIKTVRGVGYLFVVDNA